MRINNSCNFRNFQAFRAGFVFSSAKHYFADLGDNVNMFTKIRTRLKIIALGIFLWNTDLSKNRRFYRWNVYDAVVSKT